jgi:hypothetical protein
MSKKNNHHDFYDEDEQRGNALYMEERKAKRRERKIRNALKTRNIDDLMEVDDDEYYDDYYK